MGSNSDCHGHWGPTEISTPITHLREVLGEATYESLARKGEAMTTAAMVTYAFDQIDQVRAELNAVSEHTCPHSSGCWPTSSIRVDQGCPFHTGYLGWPGPIWDGRRSDDHTQNALYYCACCETLKGFAAR